MEARLSPFGPFRWFARPGLGGAGTVVFTTRTGGISRPPYDSLNLGAHVGDVGERVRLNRVAAARALPRPLREPVVGEQVHSAHVAPVGALHAGTRWEQSEGALAETDGLVTATPFLPLTILVADCLPIALVDGRRGAAAAIHAGWRGLAAGIIPAAVGLLASAWESRPGDLTAWIGPGIGACCYAVGPEVADRFPAHTHREEGTLRVDLRAAATAALAAVDVPPDRVEGLPLCTCCERELFFSHRRAAAEGSTATGRQALFVWLDPMHGR